MKRITKNKKAEGFVESGVKILIAIVIGTIVFGGTYALMKNTALETAKEKIEVMFDYKGNTKDELSSNEGIMSFFILGTEYQAEKDMTWSEWINSEYNTSNNIAIGNVRIGYQSLYIIYGQTPNDYVKQRDTITEGHIYKMSN